MLDFLFERNEQGRIINNISLDGTADTKNEYIEPLSSSKLFKKSVKSMDFFLFCDIIYLPYF